VLSDEAARADAKADWLDGYLARGFRALLPFPGWRLYALSESWFYQTTAATGQ
jgi:hypothetical protein